MGLNNRKISNQFRTIHRYLGFFLSGIMLMYSISGITLIFRKTDTFKKEVLVVEQIEKGLTQPPKNKGGKKYCLPSRYRENKLQQNGTS